MGVYNLAEVNTEPGNEATCPFSPPLGWEGDESAYLELMRQRYKDRNFNQLIIGTVWCSKKWTYITLGRLQNRQLRLLINSGSILATGPSNY
uniref:Uncharacterized protein n=2 Tax=Vibrionaceae TaxID=641 RepID=H1A9P4_PHODD|nr:hypothetical protein [Photobacterium damselae subsp. damselae]BAO48389.1 hypothetical protein [Vibrio sp. 04Ya090]